MSDSARANSSRAVGSLTTYIRRARSKTGAAILTAIAAKIAIGVATPMSYDFINWVYVARSALEAARAGSIYFAGVYTGPALILAPFYQLWLLVPTEHLRLEDIIGKFYFQASYSSLLLVILLKLPILLFDILTGVFVYAVVLRLTGSRESSSFAFLVWFLNPFNTFIMEWMGAIDVIPTSLVLLSVLLLMKNRIIPSSIVLGLAAILRLFPLLIAPALALQAFRQRGRLGLASYTIVVAIFAITGLAFLATRLGFGGAVTVLYNILQTQRYLLWFFGFPVPAGTTFHAVPLYLGLVLYPAQLYLIHRHWSRHSDLALSSAAAILLVYFSASMHQPYHLIWVIPFLTILWAAIGERSSLFPVLFFSAFAWSFFWGDYSHERNGVFFIPNYTELLVSISNGLYGLRSGFQILANLFAGVFYAVKSMFLITLNARHMGVIESMASTGGKSQAKGSARKEAIGAVAARNRLRDDKEHGKLVDNFSQESGVKV